MGDKVQWPKEMRSDPSKRNPDFLCEFHNDHGHRITDCRLLQGEVEHLSKQVYLTDMFSEKGRQSYMKNKQELPKPPSPKRTVNVITVVDEVNGVTYTAAKKMSKVTVTHGKRVHQVLDGDSITFNDEDADSLMIPHNDALIKAFEEIPEILTSKKEMQRLTRRIAARGRFISKSSEKSFKFFSVLKKQNQFEWTDECQQALKDLKLYLSNTPLLAKPKDDEMLLIYLAVSSVVLVREDKEQIVIQSDSQLVVNQMQGTYVAREARMQQYLEKVRELLRQFQSWKVVQIPREENAEANALANLVSATDVTNAENAIVIHLFHLALDQDKSEYGILPKDKKKSQLLRQKVAWYCLIRGSLYQKMFGGPLAWCLGPSQMEYVMREVHEGHCGNHVGGRSLIKRITSAPYYPAANGQDESTNKVIINNLKKRLLEPKGKWPEVLPGVLWAYRTIAKTSMGETPFSLVYGAEALIPVEIGEPSMRYTHLTEEANKEEMRVNLDLLEERREASLIRMAAQKQMIERYYNRKANLRYFKIGNFVLKKIFRSTKAANAGKLSPNWEGPYRVKGIDGKGAYELETIDGKVLSSN
ncbi:uncharacterized protein [Nicotiana tomentosiformis]|uniref:uncharacterized protein n=1 Tax=Nicotiana tomentosiformis TaxID=4098 RepID=UPI00388C79C6